MKEAVTEAIEEIEASGIGSGVRTQPDPDGGAYVIVDDVDLGKAFSPRKSWVGFHIAWTYPDDDVYPHFLDPDLKYVGKGQAPNQFPEGNLPTSVTRGGKMQGFDLDAIQVSRRSNHRSTETDSALQKLLRVLEFLRSR